MQVKKFTFNPFQENTYILHDESGECVIIDPGCLGAAEEAELADWVGEHELRPVRLLNTHCHIDHIYGNPLVHKRWTLPLEAALVEAENVRGSILLAEMWGMAAPELLVPERDLQAGDRITFGQSELEVRAAPGHSAGHVVFISHADQVVIGGDVLFRESIGRTDLPGGDHATLLNSIRTQLYTLPNSYVVHPGHGPETSIGREKASNPFVRGQ